MPGEGYEREKCPALPAGADRPFPGGTDAPVSLGYLISLPWGNEAKLTKREKQVKRSVPREVERQRGTHGGKFQTTKPSEASWREDK